MVKKTKTKSEILKSFQVQKMRKKNPPGIIKCFLSATETRSLSGKKKGEVSTGSAGLDGLRWSTAAAALGQHTRTHTQGVSYIRAHSSAQLTENPNSCVAKFCLSWLFFPPSHTGTGFPHRSGSQFLKSLAALEKTRAESGVLFLSRVRTLYALSGKALASSRKLPQT